MPRTLQGARLKGCNLSQLEQDMEDRFKVRGRKIDSRGRIMQTVWIECTGVGWKVGSATAFCRSDASVALGWARQNQSVYHWELRNA